MVTASLSTIRVELPPNDIDLLRSHEPDIGWSMPPKYHHMTSRYERLTTDAIDHCIEVVRDATEVLHGGPSHEGRVKQRALGITASREGELAQ